jgi:hypothetical protein
MAKQHDPLGPDRASTSPLHIGLSADSRCDSQPRKWIIRRTAATSVSGHGAPCPRALSTSARHLACARQATLDWRVAAETIRWGIEDGNPPSSAPLRRGAGRTSRPPRPPAAIGRGPGCAWGRRARRAGHRRGPAGVWARGATLVVALPAPPGAAPPAPRHTSRSPSGSPTTTTASGRTARPAACSRPCCTPSATTNAPRP